MSRKFATLNDVKGEDNREEDSGGDSSGEGDGRDRRQNWYVGGGEHSGQQVLGPRRGDDMVSGLFDAARRAGAEQLSPEEAAAGSSSRSGGSTRLQGGGYILGGHGMPTQPVGPPNSGGENDDSDVEEIPLQPITMTMNIWANGFSIDDGPLRDFQDPENQNFLRQIAQGRVPEEIMRSNPGKRVDFRMERKGTEYVKPKLKPFSGEGQRLGSVMPSVVVASSSNQTDSAEAEKLLKQAQDSVSLTENEPSTRIQVRLPSGQRLVGTFNHDHTVDAVRSFIVSAVPDLAFQPFQLVNPPNKLIEDETLTLKDSDLLNAVVMVKYVA